MAVINDPTTAANIARVGEAASGATGSAHVAVKPIPFSIGHYRVTHRFALVATQAAASRLFEIRNAGANLLVPTRLIVKLLLSSAHTAIIENSIDVYKAAGFTVVDTTNTVTPNAKAKRTTGMSAAPGNAQIRGVTVAGAAAGMTGGTITALADPVGQLPYIAPVAVMAATETLPRYATLLDALDDVNGTHPFVLEQNEGIVLANRALLGAAAGASVYVDFSWAEVTAY